MTILERSRSPCKPVAVFATVEVNKYRRYANFAIPVSETEVVGDILGEKIYGKNLRNASPDYTPVSIAKYQPPPKGGYGVKTNVFGGMSPRNRLLLAAGAGIGAGVAAGVGGATFLRRRRTKKGKIVVENVRRKP